MVELNRAVAVAMAEGPERGLDVLDDPELAEALDGYQLVLVARGRICCGGLDKQNRQ